MAWMVAYNEGLLDRFATDQIVPWMRRLEELVRSAGLTLASERDEWKRLTMRVRRATGEGLVA
jgi:hypothetical protein